MKNPSPSKRRSKGPGYVAAVFLGTALSTFGGQGPACGETAIPSRAITDVSRYCTASWRNARLHPDCWTDCTQEVFCRLLERLRPESWESLLKEEGEDRRELIRAIDTVRKRTKRSRTWCPLAPETVADRGTERVRTLAEERDTVWQAADKVLSERQREILQRSFDGWSVHEIATELRLPPERVSDEKYKAIRKLQQALAAA